MKHKKFLSVFLTVLLVLSTFIGCGGSSGSSGVYYDAAEKMEAAPMEPNSMAQMNSIESGSMIVSDSESDSDTQQYLDSQKLVYSCDIEVETLNFAETVSMIKDAIKKFDGFVESDSVTDDSWNWYYSDYKKNGGTMSEYIVIRIPTKSYEDFLKELEGSGKIMSKQEEVTNITKSYNDTATIIEVLEKEEDMLLEMMDKCKTIDEMISVEDRLAEVQKQLALYRSNLSGMDIDIAFSTISVRITEVMEYTRVVEEELSFIERVVEAIKESFESFVEVAEDCVILFIYVAPYTIVAVVVIIIVKLATKTKKQKRDLSKLKEEEKTKVDGAQNEENK